MRVLLSPLPAAQLHPPVQRAPARAGLCAKQVILWVEVMDDSQGHLSWDKAIEVPVYCHTVDVLSCLNIL